MRNGPVHHKDCAVACSLVLAESTSVHGDDGGNRRVRDGHVELSNGEHGLSTKVVYEENSRDGHDEVNNADDACSE